MVIHSRIQKVPHHGAIIAALYLLNQTLKTAMADCATLFMLANFGLIPEGHPKPDAVANIHLSGSTLGVIHHETIEKISTTISYTQIG